METGENHALCIYSTVKSCKVYSENILTYFRNKQYIIHGCCAYVFTHNVKMFSRKQINYSANLTQTLYI